MKRIQAARAACRFPAIFQAVAEGRLHLSGVVLLAPHLTEHTAADLLFAATHKSKSEIERLLAARFPKSDVLAWVEPIPSASFARSGQGAVGPGACQLAPGLVQTGTVPAAMSDRSSAKPLSSQSFAVQFTMSQSGHDDLRYARALLGHQVAPGDIAQVIERSLAVFVLHLEKTKFAATAKPRSGQGRPATASGRHVPAPVKRAVWVRDGGQCTFVSEVGHRCPARTRLEFDHITEFMRHKRIAAAEARATAKVGASAARAQATGGEQGLMNDEDRDVVPWLRQLGFNVSEARRAAARCEDIPDASLEQRLRVALSCFGKRSTRVGRAGEGLETAAAPAGAAPAGG